MSHIVQLIWAFKIIWGQKKISWINRLKLCNKTSRLYAAFLAFVDYGRPEVQLRWTAVSAVLSAIYDYDTDWVKTNDPERSASFRLLRTLLQDHQKRNLAIPIARELFLSDWKGELSPDGLERGSKALRFYRLVIGSRWLSVFPDSEIDLFGKKLQILDDLGDLYYDRRDNQKNCFLLPNASEFARELEQFIDSPFYSELAARFRVYAWVKNICRRRIKQEGL